MSAGAYQLGRELGRGALGRVVEVDAPDGRRLAGKILHASHRLDDRARARFHGEARLLADLRHEHLVAVEGVEPIGGEDVLLMERVDGDDLAALIAREGPLPLERIARIGAGIAAGLGAAHRAGLVHRDLKPHNVLVAPGDVAKIADFGLARTASFAEADAAAPAVVGTPDYLAPEAVDPLAVDARADLYALGCILCEMATGRPPYAAPTAYALLEAHRRAPVPALAELAPGLRRLVRWLLAKSPADRPQSAEVVAAALAELSPDTALAPVADTALSPGGGCAHCGAPLVVAVPICFSCAAEAPRLEPGKHTVFVTGPGAISHKLDSGLRGRLTDWLRSNPSLGLDPAPLAAKLPRLPFALVTGVSERCADSLVRSLSSLGLEAEAAAGTRYTLPAMRKKAWTLSSRVGVIFLSSGWYIAHSLGAAAALLVVGAPVLATAAGWQSAGRVVTRRQKVVAGAPPGLAAPLDRVAGVLPAIAEKRHRESLRAVVQRVLAVADALEPARYRELEAELSRLLDLATVAASRVDELERTLTGADLRSPDEGTRALLRERDRWAARLLDAAAFLDAFRASLQGRAAQREVDDRLAELSARIEALEEVAAL